MKFGDDELKGIYQAQTARRARGGCPSADMLLNVAAGTVSNDERRQLASHLVVCSDCAAEYRLLGANSSDSPSEAAGREVTAGRDVERSLWPRPRGFSGIRGWRPATAIALIAVATTASFFVWRASRHVDDSPERIRGGATAIIVVAPRDHSTLSEPPRELSWSAVEFADTYRVVIYDYQSTPLWESAPMAATSVELPQRVRDQLQSAPGRVSYWRVLVQHGIESDSSELFQFTISPQ